MRQYDEVIAHYTEYDEAGRLFRKPVEAGARAHAGIAAAPSPAGAATVADIGGGPGAHAFWLADQGYHVHLLDLTPKHIEQVRAHVAQTGIALADIREGDGRALPYADACFDAALLCGPLYHLPEREDRLQALREAHRVLRPGGKLFAAILSRFSPMMDKVMIRPPVDPQKLHYFAEYCCRKDAGSIHPECLYSPPLTSTCHQKRVPKRRKPGLLWSITTPSKASLRYQPDFDARWDDPAEQEHLLQLIRLVEEEESLMGVSWHQLMVGRK